jgi:hypothetical protein
VQEEVGVSGRKFFLTTGQHRALNVMLWIGLLIGCPLLIVSIVLIAQALFTNRFDGLELRLLPLFLLGAVMYSWALWTYFLPLMRIIFWIDMDSSGRVSAVGLLTGWRIRCSGGSDLQLGDDEFAVATVGTFRQANCGEHRLLVIR